MKQRNREKKLAARQRGYEAIAAKQTGDNHGFNRPGSFKK